MRFGFTTAAYGLARGCARSRGWWSATSSPSSPRAARSRCTRRAGRRRWDKTRHIFPAGEAACMSSRSAFIVCAVVGWIGLRALSLGLIPGGEALAFDRAADARRRDRRPRCRRSPTTEFAAARPGRARRRRTMPPLIRPAYPRRTPSLTACPVAYPAAVSRRPSVALRRLAAAAAALGPDDVGGVRPRPGGGALCRRCRPARPMAGRGHRQRPRRRAARAPAPSTPAELIRAMPGIDRLSLSGWAMMRARAGPDRRSPAMARSAAARPGRACLWRFHRDARRQPPLERADRRSPARRRGRRRRALAAVARRSRRA